MRNMVFICLLLFPVVALGQPVDLSLWNDESYPAVSGFNAGIWTIAGDGLSVTQSINGQPTLFYSPLDAFFSGFQGTLTVNSGGDNDYIGFVLGYQPGDVTNPSANYLLIDWKAGSQNFNFGAPSCTPGSNAPAGLAVSRVTGIPTADEFWGHTNFDEPACSDLNSGLQELARGINLGSTGWSGGTTYTIKFEFGPTNLKVFVDDVLEIDINGSFANGRFGFYNFSQADVTYAGFEEVPVGVEPSTWGNLKRQF